MVAHIRQRFPAIVISGYGDIGSVVRAMRLGAVDFLEKPIFESELLTRVHSLLDFDGGMNANCVATPGCELSRWVDAIVAVIDTESDPRTVDCWANLVGASPSALRAWCDVAEIGAKRSLDLARVLRAAWRSRQTGFPPWPISKRS